MLMRECRHIPWSRPWRGDDFDPCFRQLFVEQLVPAVIATMSVVALAVGFVRYYQRSARVRPSAPGYTPLLGSRSERPRSYVQAEYGAATSGSLSDSEDNDYEDYDCCEGDVIPIPCSLSNAQVTGDRSLEYQLPPSIRDMLLATLCITQLMLGFVLYSCRVKGELATAEVALWLWATMLCAYLFGRTSVCAPSPSPHLRFVFFAGVFIDFVKARTALLAYLRSEHGPLPVVEIAMAIVATLLFLSSFTQQRRRHGLPAYAPASASGANPPAPERTASIAQLLFFSWMDPMVWLGYKRSLEPNDIYDLMPEDNSAHVCAHWRRESRVYARRYGSDSRSLTRRLFWFFRYRLALQCVWTMGYVVFIFSGPFLLKRILAYMEDPSIYTREQAFWCVAGLLAGGTITTVCQSQALWIGRKIGMHIKSIVIGEVYAKSLRRRDAATGSPASDSSSSAKDATSNSCTNAVDSEEGDMSSLGTITNLMAVDAHKISEVSAYVHFFYQLPAEILVAVLMLYQLLGVAALAGVGAIIVLIPLQWYLVMAWNKYQHRLMVISDQRMSMTNEILQGVRIIKFFAWEPRFESQVAGVRGSELGVLRSRYLVFTYSIIVFFMAPVFLTLATFVCYTTLLGHQLTASIAFTALALFKTLRGPIDQLPEVISFCLQSKVSVDRVAKFLDEEETPKYDLCRLTRQAHDGLVVGGRRPSYAKVVGATDIGFVHASFIWKSARANDNGQPSGPLRGNLLIPAIVETLPNGECTALAGTAAAATTSNTGTNGDFELRDLTASFPVGKLSIIAGPTGCGKTSLLMALLGEMRLIEGQLMVPGAAFNARATPRGPLTSPFALHESVAYVAQQAWLLNDTIRGNITFGLPYDEQRYTEVVRMCALARDFEILDAGDMTEVGERGVALSGGQKQRICLARAVYSPARHVIMDDCLSAVDAHTAKHLFENCLMSPRMADRTRILVTHAVGLTIKGASAIVVMQEGRIIAAGTPRDVMLSGKLGEDTLHEADGKQQGAASQAESKPTAKGKSADMALTADAHQQRFDGASTDAGKAKAQDRLAPSGADAQRRGKLTTEESWARGHVQWRVYSAYLRASGGMALWAALTALFLLTQGLQIAQDWWLREWAASYSRPAGDSSSAASPSDKSALQELSAGGDKVNLAYFIGIYAAIAVASTVLILGRSLLQFWSSLKASKGMHERLLHAILRAPVRFFDTTPAGRLINRFSKDMETIDQSLSSSLAILLTELISSVAILVVIAAITPAFTLGAIAVAAIYWVIGGLYLSVSRELKRFESVTKSPIYTQFGETLSGVSTIRAYGQESRFRQSSYAKIDDNIRPFIYMWSANRWLSIRVDLAGALVSFMAGLLALTTTGRMDAGLAGLSLSYALNFTEHILWVVRFYSVNEMNLNSVERVVEYMEVKPEAPVTIPDRAPLAAWPTEGQISVEDLVLKYSDNLPPVIKGISFKVKPCEKIGIVGRTGAGKSTLALAMFRFMEASSGRIVVDGIDISQIGVGDLRSRLTIIPQDPALFSGTIRSNLDPFSEHGDDELWLALRRAHLLGDDEQHEALTSSRASTVGDDFVADSSARVATLGRTITNLEMPVAESGSNFSQGQRQLIALARALVKRTRVIILDEATASVDFDTDAKIQTTIRNEFTESTLLCIAHRLRTIVDYDRVLVLDQGEVVEYDEPYALLSKSEGLFKHMCLKSGEYEHLFSVAERKHHPADGTGCGSVSPSDDGSSDNKHGNDGKNNSRNIASRGSSGSGQGYCSDDSSKCDDDPGHVVGGWSGHVRLKVGLSTQLQKFSWACRRAICSGSGDGVNAARSLDSAQVLAVKEPHISLTKAFYLHEHQIADFVREIESCVGGMGSFSVGFGQISTYLSENQKRGFVAVDVNYGVESVRRVLDRVDGVMEKFGQRKFFRAPLLHVSLLSVDLEADAVNEMSRVGATLGKTMDEEIALLAATRVDEVECVFGNRKFSVSLHAE
ncbi:Transporter of the ATP-binding cassette (ABC) [Coemansia sp. BCRC 34301]|nr:Transporter of the ATP-binding cassette (ABC) [Coemansia sp. BCRC 34301]